jgi:Flp pilus assembly protein TadB
MDPSRQRLFIGLAVVFAVVAIFVAGYLPGRSRARAAAGETERVSERLRESQATLAQTQFDLRVARLRGRLGETLHEANANNYSVAAERATVFFDALREAVNSPQLAPGDRRQILEAVLARRDEISADLARADAAVKAKLAEMYMQFGRAVQPAD